MQLGFLRCLNSLGRFAGPPRNLNNRVLFSVRVRSMGLEKEAVKLGSIVGSNMPARNGHAKENGKGSKLDTLSIKNDPAKLDHMTVEELRTMLRNFGASTKGRKHELIARLICVMDGEVDGECSPAEDREVKVSLQKTETLHADITPRGKRKNQVVPESLKVQTGNRKKYLITDNGEPVEVKVEAVVTSQKNATETAKAQVKRPFSKRKPAAETSTEQTEASAAVEDLLFAVEPWTRFAHKKPQKDWVAYNPRTMRPPSVGPNVKSVKVVSWNVNGLRALLKVEGFSAVELAKRENFDVLCLQETKLQEKDVEKVKDMLEGYEHSFWTCSISKLGYSGTAIISRIKPSSVKYGLGISDHDSEGRLVTAEFDSFYLLNAYVPNSGDGLRRLSYRVSEWDASLSSYMKELEKTKPVILTGDLNCAHQEIDIYNPAGNKRSAGFTDEERQSFENNFLSKGFVDTFRQQHPRVVGYTYWGYRHGGRKTNKGWRLDYFLVSQSIANNVHDSYILPDITGSDHSPIGLVIRL